MHRSFLLHRSLALAIAAFAATALPALADPAPSHEAFAALVVVGDTIIQIPCARIFKPADATPVLGVPAQVSNYTMRARSCYFEGGNDTTITVYGGKGADITSRAAWDDATKSSDRINFAPLGGVGDTAYWRKDGMHNEVLSRKGDLWCSAVGGRPAKSEAEARKLGELCNKVYASGF